MTDTSSTGRRIVLVRHATPLIDPARPAGEWALDERSAGDVRRLAEALQRLGVDSLVTSPEPKAARTAHLIAQALRLRVTHDDALREQGGGTVPWFDDQAAFRSAVADHFLRHKEAVFGRESSDAAVARFREGVDRACARHSLPVLVTHGRVMCGYMGRTLGRDPMEFWSDLQMPDAYVVDPEAGTVSRVNPM